MRRAILSALFVLCVSNAHAQTITLLPNSVLQWDIAASSRAAAQANAYDIILDEKSATPTILRATGVTCTGTASPFICTAPLPAVSTGTHTLALKAVYALSGSSNTITVTQTAPDPRCIFPSGTAAVVVFPSRLVKAGQRGVIYFQFSVTAYPIIQVDILTTPTGGTPTRQGGFTGSNLNDAGAIWIPEPATSGTYAISIRATNALGCTSTTPTGMTWIKP